MPKKIKVWDNFGDNVIDDPPVNWTVKKGTPSTNKVIADAGSRGGKKQEVEHAADEDVVITFDLMEDTSNIEILGKVMAASTTGRQVSLVGRLETVGVKQHWYSGGIEGGDKLVLRAHKGDDNIEIDSVDFTWLANTYYWIRLKLYGAGVQLKVWADGDPEPAAWMIDTTVVAGPRPDYGTGENIDIGGSQEARQILVDRVNSRLIVQTPNVLYCVDCAAGTILGSNSAANRPYQGATPLYNLTAAGDLIAEPRDNPGTRCSRYSMTNCNEAAEEDDGDYWDNFMAGHSVGANYALAINDSGLVLIDPSDMSKIWSKFWYGGWDGCCYTGADNAFFTAFGYEWSQPPYPEGGVAYDGTYIWAWCHGERCVSTPCAQNTEHGLYLIGLDPSDGSVLKEFDLTSQFDSVDDCAGMVYDSVNHCLLLTVHGEAATNWKEDIVKFDLATEAVTGKCELVYESGNEGFYQEPYGGTWWFRGNDRPDTTDMYLRELDIATMTIITSIRVADINIGVGKSPTAVPEFGGYDPTTESLFMKLSGTGINDTEIHKISVATLDASWLRVKGKAGHGSGKGGNKKWHDFHSQGKGKPPVDPVGDPDPPDVEDPQGIQKWSMSSVLGPGQMNRKPYSFGRKIK